jgi:hypothetical protein
MDAMEKALMSDAIGWIDISAPGQWQVRVDGGSYGGLPPWKRQPIIPGRHTVDLFDFRGMQHVRCDVEILRQRRFLVVAGSQGNCVVTEIPANAP